MSRPRRAHRARTPAHHLRGDAGAAGAVAEFMAELEARRQTGPRLTGGDLDANWQNAWDAGDEAVGGSTSTPGQDVVDELGDALGVPQAPDAEVQSSVEILADRDLHRWTLEREVAREACRAEDDEEDDR